MSRSQNATTPLGNGLTTLPRRAAVLCPTTAARRENGARSPESRLDEAVRLAEAIGLQVSDTAIIRLQRYTPATLIGRGAVEAWRDRVATQQIEVVVIDTAVSPVQQRNLERAWSCKVIDRTGLILEIFGERARTREGQLQVELAALTYQRSRLVKSWTHLERQRGGFGFLGGPGESQLEIDRRLIGERIVRIKRDLEDVKRTRGLHRKARRRVPYPVVALVGYTNAGKSTLFNRLTRAAVLAEDILFATLDPTIRLVRLPSGRAIALSDTVGFISDLPLDLVAAFRATLEEVQQADLIVHVRDISHPESAAQQADVLAVLGDLGLDPAGATKTLDALNKIDRLDSAAREQLVRQAERVPRQVPISATTGEGCDALLETIDDLLSEARRIVEMRLPHREGGAIAWLYQHGEVLGRRDDDEYSYLRVRLDPADLARFERLRQGEPRATKH